MSTLVLYGKAAAAARKMLPKLPDDSFVAMDRGPSVREVLSQAVEQGTRSAVVIGDITELAGIGGNELLSEVTEAVDGGPELTAEVVVSDPAQVYKLWAAARLLGPAGRELCRRVADGLDGAGLAVQVVLLDGDRMVAMYGRLAR